MKPLKIYLQYPWAFPDSPYYKYLIETPPEGIEYLNIEKQKGAITNKKKFKFLTFIKKNIRAFTNFLGLNLPNAHLSPSGKYNLIHCAHCLSKNRNKPWVADIESFWSMWVSGMHTKRGKEKVKKILLQENCKRILPWTEYTKKEILKILPEIKNKLEVVYPAIPLNITKRRFDSKRVAIVYVSRHFNLKGGEIALRVFSKLKEQYREEIETIFISDNTSKEMQENYPLVKMQGLVSKKKLEEIYRKSDIFFYPSFVDTFGFAILEAMSYGLPVVALDAPHTKSVKEILKNKEQGFLVKTELLYNSYKKEELGRLESELLEKLEILIRDKRLREKLSSSCIEEIKNGKFSIKKRNKKLGRIYEKAAL